MDDYLRVIQAYLPIVFTDAEAIEFIAYLSSAYSENLENEKYQFSFTAFHMLNMVFIYKVKWFLLQQGSPEIEESLQNFSRQHHNASFNTLFDLSQLPESTSLEKVLMSLNFHVNDIGICKNHVDVRNKCAHASGRVYYKTQPKIDYYIEEEIEYIQKIQSKLTPALSRSLQRFLDDNWSKSLIKGDVRAFLEENYFSEKDLEQLIEIGLPLFSLESNNERVIHQKILYLVLIYEIQDLLNSEENIFLKKLPILMNGMVEEIEVSEDGEVASVFTESLIEECISPLISNFSEPERKEAEAIMNF